VDGVYTLTVNENITVSAEFEEDAPAISTLATFEFGANGAATHKDGNDLGASKSYSANGYTLALTGMSKVFGPAYDSTGKSCLKLGTGKVVGSFTFTVPADVTTVVINVAQYKTNTTNITINGTQYSIATSSNNGEYTAIEIDTSATKTITFGTTGSTYRCMVDSIVFIG
ncbi:MAG: hypothetical protein IKM34_05400, partial [Clostridia bacterium]|nr:hypothetical protein [Clostridia bacterium]